MVSDLLGERGIRVNCVVPGGIKSNQDPEFIQNYSNRVPLGRMANPSDIVGIFLYLIVIIQLILLVGFML